MIGLKCQRFLELKAKATNITNKNNSKNFFNIGPF